MIRGPSHLVARGDRDSHLVTSAKLVTCPIPECSLEFALEHVERFVHHVKATHCFDEERTRRIIDLGIARAKPPSLYDDDALDLISATLILVVSA